MANSRRITVEIIGDTKSLERALGRAGKKAETGFSRISRGARLASFALGAGLAAAVKVGFDELAESQKVMAQTRAVLKSTGGAAKVTAKDVDRLSSSLSEMSGVDDEVIAASENMLLTFRNIRNETGKGNDVFKQATEATLDLSVAMGKDLQSSSILVGKALNDPIKGMGALRRVGVTLDEGQQDLVKSLVKTGHTMEAQKIILKELNTEFGGSAKAAGDTLPGQLNKARNAFEEMAGSLATALLPALTSLAEKVLKASKFLQEHRTLTKSLVVAIGTLAVVLGTVSVGAKVYAAALALVTVATKAWTVATRAATVAQLALNLALTANPIGLVVVAVAALAAGIVVAYKRSERFRNTLQTVWAWLKAVGAAADATKKKIDDLLPNIPGFLRGGLLPKLGIDFPGAGGGGSGARGPRAGAPPGLRGPNSVTFTGPIHVHGVKNTKELLAELQKESRRRSPQTRGLDPGSAFGF